jgi:hypothetical protein
MDIWDHDFSQVNIYSHIMHTCIHLGLSSSSKIHNDTNFEHRHWLIKHLSHPNCILSTLWCTVPKQILKQSVRIEAFFEFHYHTWFYKFVFSREGYESSRIQDSWQPLAWSIIPLTSPPFSILPLPLHTKEKFVKVVHTSLTSDLWLCVINHLQQLLPAGSNLSQSHLMELRARK